MPKITLTKEESLQAEIIDLEDIIAEVEEDKIDLLEILKEAREEIGDIIVNAKKVYDSLTSELKRYEKPVYTIDLKEKE